MIYCHFIIGSNKHTFKAPDCPGRYQNTNGQNTNDHNTNLIGILIGSVGILIGSVGILIGSVGILIGSVGILNIFRTALFVVGIMKFRLVF